MYVGVYLLVLLVVGLYMVVVGLHLAMRAITRNGLIR
jgi:hypothetical protein